MKALVPQFILSRQAAGKKQGTFDAAVLSLDLVGFCRLTETLMAGGDRGAEQLASQINAVFEPIIATITQFGGDVVGISGDNVTAVFEGGHRVAAACACQVRMLITESEGMDARMGLAEGAVDWRIYSDDAQRGALYRYSGVPFRLSAEAQMRARPQQVLSANGLGFTVVDQVRSDAIQPAADGPPVDLAAQADFLPYELDHVRTNGEFRHIVAAFVQLPEGLDDEGVAQVAALILRLRLVHGGLGLRFDVGDKGCHIYLFWGAPIAHERDAERALNFLRALHDEGPENLRSGAAYGMAYAGLIGGAALAEYTCYGEVTNLAARLMMSARPGEIKIDAALAAKTEDVFDARPEAPLNLKGFDQPIQNQLVLSRHQVRRKRDPITQIGRADEMDELLDLVDNNDGGARLIWGEAGIGKSRLLEEVQRLRPNRQWLVAASDPTPSNGLGVISSIAMQILGNPKSHGELGTSLAAIGAAHRTGWTMFQVVALAQSVGLAAEDAAFEELSAEARSGFEAEALVKLLEAAGPQAVVLIEDIHWLDTESAAILIRLLQRRSTPGRRALTLLFSTRPDPTTLPVHLLPAKMLIPAMTENATSALMAAQLGGPISTEFTRQIFTVCEGNPFFTLQTIKALQEAGSIGFHKGLWRLNVANGPVKLPSDVRTLLVSRMDRLSKEARNLIDAASVIGRDISRDLLSDMLGDVPSDDLISRLITAEIWTQFAQDQYAFQHALLHEVAYDLQPTASRAELHRKAYAALNARRANHGDLGFHADRSGNADAALTHYTTAAEIAADAYQIDRAAGFYGSAVALIAPDDAATRYPVLRALSDMLAISGDIRLADLLDQIEEIAPRIGQQAQIDLIIARLEDFARRGDVEKVVELGRHNMAWIDDRGTTANRIDLRLILSYALQFLYSSETFAQSRQMAFKALDLANEIGDRVKIRAAHYQVGLSHRYSDDPIAREQVAIALSMTNDPIERGRMLKTLGSILKRQGDTAAAIRSYGDALETAQRIGARRSIGSTQYVLASHYLEMGDFYEANHYYTAAYAVALETDNIKLVHDTSHGIGRMQALRGDVAAALSTWDNLVVSIALQPKPDDMGIKIAIAYGQLVAGDWGKCLQNFSNAAELATQRGLWHDAIDATMNVISCRLELGDLAGLDETISRLLEDAETKPMVSRFQVSEAERDVLRLELLTLRAVFTLRSGGSSLSARRDAERVFAEVGDHAHSEVLIDTRTLLLGPNGRAYSYLAEVLQSAGSPKSKDVLKAAARHIGRLADCTEASGFSRDSVWAQNVFRRRLVAQCAAIGIIV